MDLAFVEAARFARRWVAMALQGAHRGLQETLLQAPDPGRRKGTRGGARVHYLWLPRAAVIYLMVVYSKDDMETLSPGQKKALKAIVQEIKARHR